MLTITVLLGLTKVISVLFLGTTTTITIPTMTTVPQDIKQVQKKVFKLVVVAALLVATKTLETVVVLLITIAKSQILQN